MTYRISTTSTEYNTIHQYRLRHSTKSGTCEHCKQIKKTQWANKSGQYDKHDDNDWLELCHKCHTAYDVKYHNKSMNRPFKCHYCRQYFKGLNKYPILTKHHIKQVRLCDECYVIDQLAQQYYDGTITYEDFIVSLPETRLAITQSSYLLK